MNYHDKILTKDVGNIFLKYKGSKKYQSFIHKTKFIGKMLNIQQSSIKGVSNEQVCT